MQKHQYIQHAHYHRLWSIAKFHYSRKMVYPRCRRPKLWKTVPCSTLLEFSVLSQFSQPKTTEFTRIFLKFLLQEPLSWNGTCIFIPNKGIGNTFPSSSECKNKTWWDVIDERIAFYKPAMGDMGREKPDVIMSPLLILSHWEFTVFLNVLPFCN